MADIKLLSKEVRELIAAGEVVERPASVVKELVENAVDAGATVIEIEIRKSGLALIRVTDNGKGIERDQVPVAFLRHATSKVEKTPDLESIETLGFRGEALAAVCAVSKVRLVTKTADTPNATEYVIEAGEEVGLDDTGAPDGTTVYVAELFYNTPARMKFLKKDVHEGNAVQTIAEQLALSHPEISFRFVREGRTVFTTPGDGELYSAVFSLLPRDITEDMVKVSPLSDEVRVWGYISSPQKARASRSLQYVFVNGRFIKSRSISAAVAEAGKNLMMQGKHPSFVLNIELTPQDVDVNVHPAKTEVRFKNDRAVFSAVYSAVKIALTEYAGDFKRQTAPEQQKEEPDIIESGAEPIPLTEPETTPVKLQPEAERSFMTFVPESEEEKKQIQLTLEQAALAYETTKNKKIDIEYAEPKKPGSNIEQLPQEDTTEQPSHPADEIRVIGELFDTYIVAQYGTESVLFIDKHAAHERLLFEQLAQEGAGCERQILLEPVLVSLSWEEKQALLENPDMLLRIGFLTEEFGEGEVAVREAPTYLAHHAILDAVTEIAVKLVSQSNDVTTSQTEWLLHSVACRAAIKAGHKTGLQELVKLTNDILYGTLPKFCPHGRPVYFIMDRKEMEKRFGRI